MMNSTRSFFMKHGVRLAVGALVSVSVILFSLEVAVDGGGEIFSVEVDRHT